MTIKEANAIYYINLEIKRIEKDIAELEASRSYYKPINLDGMPRGSPGGYSINEKYLEKHEQLDQMLNTKLRELKQKQLEFETFLDSIEDSELRLIMRLRCINNMTWEEIGTEMGYHRTSVSGKFYAYFNQ